MRVNLPRSLRGPGSASEAAVNKLKTREISPGDGWEASKEESSKRDFTDVRLSLVRCNILSALDSPSPGDRRYLVQVISS